MANETKILLGLTLGVLAGGIAGLLLAPQSGKETRAQLKDTAEGLKEDIETNLDRLSEKLDDETLNGIKETYLDSKNKIKEEYSTVAKKVKELENEIEQKIKQLKNEVANV